MKKRFYDPHPGLSGCSEPIPESVRLVANSLADRQFVELDEAVQLIQNACAEGTLDVFDDMILLRVGEFKLGDLLLPQYSWRVIRLEEITSEDVCPRCFNSDDKHCFVCDRNDCQ